VQKQFLRPQVWVCWILISLCLASGCFAQGMASDTAPDSEPDTAQASRSSQGLVAAAPGWTVVNLHGDKAFRASLADINLQGRDDPPEAGWQSRPMPQISLAREAVIGPGKDITAWARVEFDQSMLAALGSNAPLALMTENNREHVTVYLNGVELFNNAADRNARVLGWNRTYLVLLPQALLKADNNQLIIRVGSRAGFNLGIGTIAIGHQQALSDYTRSQTAKRITGPLVANLAMVILAGVAMLMWFARREEKTILWLVLSSALWFVRNYHFFAPEAPFDPALFRDISYYSIYFAISASLSFCVVFLNLPKARWIILCMFAAGIALSLGRWVIFEVLRNDGLVSLVALGVVVIVLALMIRDAFARRTLDHFTLIGVVCAIVGLSLHDIGRISNLAWWDGLGFHSQPYVGLFLFIVFSVSVGRRFVGALTMVERLNVTLEHRVDQARNELAASEAARRELEVLSAVDSERERLMREMHDGIGSNLITALAIAQKQDESPGTIATLKRAISDLKITVDSLAPVEGDVVALLANFRHRLEPDLKLAGIKCVWGVQPCPALPWLDPVNALQMLRIIQEAIGNVLAHARATRLEIACYPEPWPNAPDGKAGIAIVIMDDGVGFDVGASDQLGRGLANIAARARALGGTSTVVASKGAGCRVWLWLPLSRQ
jgi:signal transduction histidine kinase